MYFMKKYTTRQLELNKNMVALRLNKKENFKDSILIKCKIVKYVHWELKQPIIKEQTFRFSSVYIFK